MISRLEQSTQLRVVFSDVQGPSLLGLLIEYIARNTPSISKEIKEPYATNVESYPIFKNTGNYEFELAMTSWENTSDLNLQISLVKIRGPFSRQDLDYLNHYAFSIFKPNETFTGGSLTPLKNLTRYPFDERIKLANLKLNKFPHDASEFLSQEDIEKCLSLVDSKDGYLLIVFKDFSALMPEVS